MSRLQVEVIPTSNPLKVTDIIVHVMMVMDVLAPVLDGVPIILAFPGAILLLAWAPMNWTSPAVGPTSLPGGGRRMLGLLWGSDGLLRGLLLRTAPAVTQGGPLIHDGTL